ncbi:hypothetical protein [Actinomadura sp. HBU206391]|uniref:hypothetical protein n=1 Tax=Actinomadura sp. HBU206391 TaxID=2731692 RepID=UPI00164F49F5|nr:hypothetical protein [Actinomadura sp. HBU206391]MBC6457194.1 hypothetical protein [Actinomadura sp. HBU206391]
MRALEKAELQGVRFHDLRHTGNTLSAMAKAELKQADMKRSGTQRARKRKKGS